jgi:hypothetical protein
LSGGKLGKDRTRAEKWAQHLYRFRHFGLLPAYHAARFSPIPLWKMQNHWFFCRV